MSDILLLAVVTSATTGNGPSIVLGNAYSGLFQTEVQAGAVDGRSYSYRVTEGTNWMEVRGTYNASARAISVDKVFRSSIAGALGTTQMTLAGGAVVTFTPQPEDFFGLRDHRVVTTSSDALLGQDNGSLVAFNSAAAVAVTIAQASSTGDFPKGWNCYVKNINTGDVTFTPATSTIEGAATFVLKNNQAALIYSTGTNYRVLVFRNDFGSAAVRADTDFPRTDVAQTLNATQKALARANIATVWEPISSASAAGATAALVALPSGYSQFKLIVQNINPSAAATLYGQLSPNGGTSFDGGSTDYNYQMTKHAGSNITTFNADSNIMVFASNIAASARGQIEITIDPGSGSQFPNMFWQSAFLDGSTNKVDLINGAAMRSTTGRYSALNFITNAGTFVTCDVYLLGRR